jgi:hypothetical protein
MVGQPFEATEVMGVQTVPPKESPAPYEPIPSGIFARPVLSTDEAVQRIASTATDEPFLVAGWIYRAEIDCFVPPDFPVTPLLTPCGSGYHLSGVNGSVASFPLVIDPGSVSEGIPTGLTVVFQVHAHDARAAECPPAYRQACDAAVVVEALVWP